MDDKWYEEIDCPQFIDFAAPVLPLDENYFVQSDEVGSLKASVDDATEKCEENQRKPSSGKILGNICTSLDEWTKKRKTANTQSKQKPVVRRSSSENTKADSMNPPPPPQRELRARGSLKRSHSFTKHPEESESFSPAAKKRSSSGIKPSQRQSSTSRPGLKRAASNSSLPETSARPGRLTRTGSTGSLRAPSPASRSGRSSSAKRVRNSSLDRQGANTSTQSNPNSHKMGTKVVATSPTFMRRLRNKSVDIAGKVKSTEELEMEQTAIMRKALRDRLKKNKENCKKAIAGKVNAPLQACVVSKTMTKEFHFLTDSRVKSQKMETRSESKDFVSSLRSDSQPQQRQIPVCGVTIVKPFNLSESRKARPEENLPAAKFKSMAEDVKDFHRRTPERFRSKVKEMPARSRTTSPPRSTIPKTPSLETRSRSRPMEAPSQQDLEEQELELMKKNQFKAHPVNHKIFSHPGLGLKKVESKPVTQVEEFSLTADQKVRVNCSHEEEKFEFHARPVPTKILEGVVGVKPAKKVETTIPQSPALSVKLRARLPRLQPEEEEKAAAVLRRPVPHTGIPFQPQLSHKHVTVEPFQFEERDKARRAQKEEKIKQYQEEINKARIFQANPLPESAVSGQVVLPPKQPKPTTVLQPFDLAVDKRGEKRLREFHHKVEEERQHEKEAAEFKAQANNIIYKEPFVPKKAGRHLVDISEFELNTERRAHEREAQEQQKKVNMARLEACMREREIQRMEEEKKKIAQARQRMVHKAQPVRHYKPVAIQASNKPMTKPLTPNLTTSRRTRFFRNDESV